MFYLKHSEGAAYNDGTSGREGENDDAVPPGGIHTYTCMFLSAQAPNLTFLLYILWPYHSHVNETSDENAGLIGPIIITREGMGNPGGSPKDVN